jgi:hypothetical protein
LRIFDRVVVNWSTRANTYKPAESTKRTSTALKPGAGLAAARAARGKDFENEKNEKNDLLNNVNP